MILPLTLLVTFENLIIFIKVKRRNSEIQLKPNAGVKYDPNKMISDRRCVKEKEIFQMKFTFDTSPCKTSEIGFVPGQNTD